MYSFHRRLREERNSQETHNPSFSSTLLDQIYRSIDEGDKSNSNLKFYGQSMGRKQVTRVTSKTTSSRTHHKEGAEENRAKLQRVRVVEKWMENKVSDKQRRQILQEFQKKSLHGRDHVDDHEQDTLFFSSTSISSDSSSGGFSSSDTESLSGARPMVGCFLPPRPKPLRTSTTSRSEKIQRAERKQREIQDHVFDGYNTGSKRAPKPQEEEGLIKSKSRALKIYSNLKKIKQPISPGSRLTSFIGTLFANGSTKNAKKSASVVGYEDLNPEAQRKWNSGQVSTCSSASSFSRSCLSKNSASSEVKWRNGEKRSVRFCPMSVIASEDCRPWRHKSLYEKEEEEEERRAMVPSGWRIGRSGSRRTTEKVKCGEVMERSRRVEEMASEFLNEYRMNHQRKDSVLGNVSGKHLTEDEDEDSDAMSCSSSDLFELDHLSGVGNDRYREELPVYETTRLDSNHAIASGLLMY